MTPAEAAVLLAGIAVFDNRKSGTPDEADRTATLWARALHDVSLPDAGAAVTEHFASSTDYLMPGHIRAIVRRIRAKRITEAGDLTPPPGLTEPETRAWLREARRRIADGTQPDLTYGELKPRHLPDMRALMPAPDTQSEEIR